MSTDSTRLASLDFHQDTLRKAIATYLFANDPDQRVSDDTVGVMIERAMSQLIDDGVVISKMVIGSAHVRRLTS